MSFDASKYKEYLIKMCVSVHGLGEYAYTEHRVNLRIVIQQMCVIMKKSHGSRGLEACTKTLGCVSFQTHLTDVVHRMFID